MKFEFGKYVFIVQDIYVVIDQYVFRIMVNSNPVELYNEVVVVQKRKKIFGRGKEPSGLNTAY